MMSDETVRGPSGDPPSRAEPMSAGASARHAERSAARVEGERQRPEGMEPPGPVASGDAVLADSTDFPLRIVDGVRLSRRYRDALVPGGMLADSRGRARQLPRYFYEVPTWDAAMDVRLAPDFHLWEFIQVDVRESDLLRRFPRYVPCAVTLLGACLQRFREAVGTTVHIAANGGYRSPRHGLSRHASPHCWATAVNIFRIGDTFLDTREAIEKYSSIAREALPGVWTRPYGTPAGFAEDHLHLDLGYVVSVPRDAPGEGRNPKLDAEPM